MHRRTRILVLAACASASITLMTGQAVASANTLYVSHTAPPGNDTSCATAAHSSVQAAVNAAKTGDQVYLCDATTPFVGSVLIKKQINLSGVPGATIEADQTSAASGMPNTDFFSNQDLVTPNSVVTVIGNVNVQISGLTIEGPFNNGGSCAGDDFGVLQIGTPSGQLQMKNDQVLDIGAADQVGLGGCQYGVGIQIGRRYWPNTTGANGGFTVVDFAGNAQLTNDSVSGYQKNGITADGPGTKVQITGATVNGGGQNPQIARNGIQISRGATGQVNKNTVKGNEYTGTGTYASATGVLVYGGCGDPLSTNVQVNGNTLTNNDTGVAVTDTQSDCITAPSTPTQNQVNNNVITKSDGETNQSGFDSASGISTFPNCSPTIGSPPCQYNGYQAGVSDTGNHDQVNMNTITGTIVAGMDTAYGPQTTGPGPFLAPIDIQTYPPINTQTNGNTFDGAPTTPPY